MWCSGNDVNEEGTAVILYEAMTSHPNTDTIARRNHVQCRPTASYAGGRPSYYNDDLHVQTIVIEPLRQSNPKCRICEDELFLLVQIYAPLDSWNGSGDTGEREGGVALDRTIYVFGCNRGTCGNRVGSFRCLRSQAPRPLLPVAKESDAQMRSLGVSEQTGVVNNASDVWQSLSAEWESCEGDAFSFKDTSACSGDNLNEMVAALTASDLGKTRIKMSNKRMDFKDVDQYGHNSCIANSNQNPPVQNEIEAAGRDEIKDKCNSTFIQYQLQCYDEPPCKACVYKDEQKITEEDCIGLGTVSKSSDDVERLIQRYLNDEDDERIRSIVLQSTTSKRREPIDRIMNAVNCDSWGEKEEKLPRELRAFLIFTDRVARASGQIVRYAYNGIPMWSAPAPIEDKKAVKFRRRDGKKHLVPKCPCGAPREFEFQVLPSLLHLLDVDSHFTPHRTTGEAENCLYPYSSKGMNWGVVAIFSCSASCPLSREEFIVVQDSPEKTTGTKRNQSDVEDTVVVI